jgi:type II secretory pathway component PulF
MAFQCVALTPDGQRRTGRIEAETKAEALARIRDMGQQPVQLRAAEAEAPAVAPARRARRITSGDITAFTRQLADLTLAGLTLDRSFSVLAEQAENAALQALIEAVQAEVRGGAALSQALERHPRYFPPMVVNMIRAGELSGQLGEVLERLAQFAEREQQRRAQILSAMVYPAVLLVVAASTLAFLLTFVVPRLSGVFADLGAELPLPTRLLLAMTGALTSGWWAILGAGVLLWLGFRTYRRTEAGAYQVDRLALRLAVVGKVWRKVVIARFARALGTLVAGGVPILEALRVAGQASVAAAGEAEIEGRRSPSSNCRRPAPSRWRGSSMTCSGPPPALAAAAAVAVGSAAVALVAVAAAASACRGQPSREEASVEEVSREGASQGRVSGRGAFSSPTPGLRGRMTARETRRWLRWSAPPSAPLPMTIRIPSRWWRPPTCSTRSAA